MRKLRQKHTKKTLFPFIGRIVTMAKRKIVQANGRHTSPRIVKKAAFNYSTKVQKKQKNQNHTAKFSLLPQFFLGLFFLLSAVLLLATIKGQEGNPDAKEIRAQDQAAEPFELSPERGRYAHTVALAENGSLSLSQPLADAVYPDVGYVDGRFYSFFAPGISILAVPFYKLGSYFNLAQVATFSIISLFALGTMFFLYRIGKDIFNLSIVNALLAPVLFAFGSTAWSYATTLYQHHLTTFFIISSFYAVWRYGKKTRLSFLWGAYIWTAYALAFTVDYPNLVLMLPVMVYFFLSSVTFATVKKKLHTSLRPAFLLTSIIFLFLSFFHGYYNHTQFGSWKMLSGSIVGYRDIKERNLTLADTSEIEKISARKTSTSFFKEEQLPRGLYTLLLAPDKGLFFFSPVFLLGVAAIVSLLRFIETKKAILLSILGVNLFLYASFGDPWGGWAFGPRYLILSMSVLSLFIAIWLSQVKRQIFAKGITLVLFAYSSAISLIGVLTTNAVPPKVEADYLHSKYGYFLNLDYFRDGKSSSFLYNHYFADSLSLQEYFMILYITLLVLFAAILWYIPKSKLHTYEA